MDTIERAEVLAFPRRREEAPAWPQSCDGVSDAAALVGFVVHEARSPLTVILGNAQRLSRSDLDPAAEDALDEVIRGARRLAQVLDDWTELAVTSGTEPLRLPFRLDAAVREAVEEHRRVHPRRDVLVREMRPCVARGSRSWTLQILRNLLSNAEKYSPTSTPIEVELLEAGPAAELHVRDRGIGVPEDTEALFEPFWREAAARRLAGGLGVGLAASRRLARAQGGSVSANPRAGGGSDFALTLPADLAAPAVRGGRCVPPSSARLTS